MRALLLTALIPAPAFAHPHVFVDTTVRAVFDDQGRMTGLRIGWTYDELFSLLLVEDGGHDTDGDGSISDIEMKALDGFDMDWGSDFLGDTYPEQDGRPLALVTGPQDWVTGWKDGRLWSEHTRTFAAPVDMAEGPVVIKAYDPGYYAAYAIVGEAGFDGRADCTSETFVPDLDAMQEELMASLKEYMPGDDLEEIGFPEVGEQFSEELRITCGG